MAEAVLDMADIMRRMDGALKALGTEFAGLQILVRRHGETSFGISLIALGQQARRVGAGTITTIAGKRRRNTGDQQSDAQDHNQQQLGAGNLTAAVTASAV